MNLTSGWPGNYLIRNSETDKAPPRKQRGINYAFSTRRFSASRRAKGRGIEPAEIKIQICSPLALYKRLLWLMVLIFTLRVIGQLIQVLHPVTWLPDLTQWQGSNMPYWLLFIIQIIIVCLMVNVAKTHAMGHVKISRIKGLVLFWVGVVYFFTMFARLLTGVLGLSELSWFQKMIPAFFHLILAAFVMLVGMYHMQWIFADKANHDKI